jgi:mutator protein MutT
MIKLIIEKDLRATVKVVIIDNENRVLFLRRSKYHKKYAGELDLPGGHIEKGESINKALDREVLEETSLVVKHAVPFKTIGNIYFFHMKYDFQEIKISEEHVDYNFYRKEDLDRGKKFEKIALEILEMLKSD